MKRVLVLHLMALASMSLHGQWYEVNSNTLENMHNIFFLDSLNGYAVGGGDENGFPLGNGVILNTTDGGENWTVIFSQDSLSMRYIAVISDDSSSKVYGFAVKDGASYLVSTDNTVSFENWNIEQVEYTPIGLRVYAQNIYFVDAVDFGLKRMSINNLEVLKENVARFNVNEYGIVTLDVQVSEIAYASILDQTFIPCASFPLGLNANMLNFSDIAMFNDTILIKTTYGSSVIYSVNLGISWIVNNGGPEKYGSIFSPISIFSLSFDNHLYFTSDVGQNWYDQGSFNIQSIHSFYDMGFLLGENGVIFKTYNLNILGTDNNFLKKKINIFPNPSSKQFKIQIDKSLSIESMELMDSSGRTIRSYYEQKDQLNLKGFASGVYFLHIVTNEGRLSKRLVVQ